MGRWLWDSEGSWTDFRDLSVLMEGEVARRAAREWREGAGEGNGQNISQSSIFLLFLWCNLTFRLFDGWFCHFFAANVMWLVKAQTVVWAIRSCFL